jgi:hypothetical protein
MNTARVIRDMDVTEPAGISKYGPRWTVHGKCFQYCKGELLRHCNEYNIPEKQIGKIIIKHLTSSICWILQISHEFLAEPSSFISPSRIIAPLFRNPR